MQRTAAVLCWYVRGCVDRCEYAQEYVKEYVKEYGCECERGCRCMFALINMDGQVDCLCVYATNINGWV